MQNQDILQFTSASRSVSFSSSLASQTPGTAPVKRNELAINLAAHLLRRKLLGNPKVRERARIERSINLNDIAASRKIARYYAHWLMRRISSPCSGYTVSELVMLLDIIGSNASCQTIREISYRLVAALALCVTAYSWNAQSLLIAIDVNRLRGPFPQFSQRCVAFLRIDICILRLLVLS